MEDNELQSAIRPRGHGGERNELETLRPVWHIHARTHKHKYTDSISVSPLPSSSHEHPHLTHNYQHDD